MGPTITFGGIGSGMDIEGLISGLMGVSRQPISGLKTQASAARAAVTDLSDIGGLLSKLKTAASNLDTLQGVGSFQTTSSNESALGISANGFAQPGTYDVQVLQLSAAERRYSDGVASSNQALGHTGTLTLQFGSGDTISPDSPILIGGETANISIEASDTLDSVIKKVNDSGLRVAASSFFDGKEYRLQIRALDAGEDNAMVMVQTGFDMGLEKEANIASRAQNAQITVDGFLVESPTNTISQAIPGVSLALKNTTTDPFTISVAEDPEALGGKVKDFVDAYNAVIKKVHETAGFGTAKAKNASLAGDSTLRGITTRLSAQLSRTYGSESINTMASLGVQLNNDGTLKLDQSKLTDAIAKNSKAVTNIMAGNETTSGFMDMIRDLTDTFTEPNHGSLEIRKDGLDARASRFDDRIETEEKRLTTLEERLRKTFTQMDSTVAGYNAQLNYLIANT